VLSKGFRNKVSGTKFLEQSFWNKVSGTKFLEQSFWNLCLVTYLIYTVKFITLLGVRFYRTFAALIIEKYFISKVSYKKAGLVYYK